MERNMVVKQVWIRTGAAMRLLGYKHHSNFISSFSGVISCRKMPSGQYQWLRAEVEALADKCRVPII